MHIQILLFLLTSVSLLKGRKTFSKSSDIKFQLKDLSLPKEITALAKIFILQMISKLHFLKYITTDNLHHSTFCHFWWDLNFPASFFHFVSIKYHFLTILMKLHSCAGWRLSTAFPWPYANTEPVCKWLWIWVSQMYTGMWLHWHVEENK